MIQIEEKDFNLLVNILFNDYFLDYLEEVIGDKNNEVSVVTLFRGMDYFIELCDNYNISFPYASIKQYIESNYEDGGKLFLDLQKRYDGEIIDYQSKDLSFRDIYSKLNF